MKGLLATYEHLNSGPRIPEATQRLQAKLQWDLVLFIKHHSGQEMQSISTESPICLPDRAVWRTPDERQQGGRKAGNLCTVGRAQNGKGEPPYAPATSFLGVPSKKLNLIPWRSNKHWWSHVHESTGHCSFRVEATQNPNACWWEDNHFKTVVLTPNRIVFSLKKRWKSAKLGWARR